MMNSVIRWTEWLSDWLGRFAAVILGLMTVLIVLEILLWNTLEMTTLIADEYSAYGLAAIVFLGAGLCLKEGGHIRITLVLQFLPDKLMRAIACASTALTTVFMGYLWWYLFKMVMSTHHYGSTSGTLTNTPLWIPQTVMLIGAAGFFLQFLGMTLKTFRAIGSEEKVVM